VISLLPRLRINQEGAHFNSFIWMKKNMNKNVLWSADVNFNIYDLSWWYTYRPSNYYIMINTVSAAITSIFWILNFLHLGWWHLVKTTWTKYFNALLQSTGTLETQDTSYKTYKKHTRNTQGNARKPKRLLGKKVISTPSKMSF